MDRKRQYKIKLVKKKIKNKLDQERTKYSKQKMVRSKLRKCGKGQNFRK